MIYDSLTHLSLYSSVLPQLPEVVRMLSSGNLDLTPGAHKTGVDGLRYNVACYETLESDKEYEIHRKEVDVQVMLSGVECIDSSPRALASLAGPYSDKDDCALVQGDRNARIILSEGMFAIYFPGEPHKPGLAYRASEKVKKVIFKITI